MRSSNGQDWATFLLRIISELMFSRFVTSTVFQVVYGYHIVEDDDPMLKLTSDFMEIIHKSGPVAMSPAEFLPWCKSFFWQCEIKLVLKRTSTRLT